MHMPFSSHFSTIFTSTWTDDTVLVRDWFRRPLNEESPGMTKQMLLFSVDEVDGTELAFRLTFP